MGNAGLFTGIETYNWSFQDFHNCMSFCSLNGIDVWYLKCYEITQGEWYSSLGGSFQLMSTLQKAVPNVKIIPYGYFYGNDVLTEGSAISTYLSKWGHFCIDVEGEFDNHPEKMNALIAQINKAGGILYCSTWANPNTHNYTLCLKELDKIVDVWMPQIYTDSLLKEFYQQWISTTHPVEPTFHIVNTPAADCQSFHHFSLWEYQLAQQNYGTFQTYLELAKGNLVGTYPVNNLKMVANFLPTSEFQPGKSEFECGAFNVSLCGRATNYNVGNGNDPQRVIQWAEYEYAKTTGSNGPGNEVGASIANMHTMIKDTQVPDNSRCHPPNSLNYWDIISISATSQQSNDINQIKAAIEHGYAVIATVSEASVRDVQLGGKNPYWWGASGNHILTYVGISERGNLLAVDPANVNRGDGNLQTPKTVLAWPREYDIRYLDNSWATIIKFPWLPDIKDGNPLGWPPYSITPPTPQPDPIVGVTVTYDEKSKQLIFSNNNVVLYRQTLS